MAEVTQTAERMGGRQTMPPAITTKVCRFKNRSLTWAD